MSDEVGGDILNGNLVRYNDLPKPKLANEWPVGLAAEISLNALAVGDVLIVDDEELCKQFGLDQETLDAIRAHPAFRAEVRECIKEIKDTNATIKRKAKLSFEMYLTELVPKMMNDERVNPDVKLKTLMYLGKVMGLDAAEEAAKASESQKQTQNTPSIQIVLTTATPVQQPQVNVIEAERVS